MEKKSTKIAYGVAFGIFVVLMVILGVSYPDGVYGTFWSLLPPIIAIGLALMTKEVYSNKELYYNQNGQLVMINVTKPVVNDALEGARSAYAKAYEVDIKQSKLKDVTAGLENIVKKYLDEGMNKYMLGDAAAASLLFEKAALASEVEPYNTPDTTAFYNAGFTAWADKDYEKAKKYFEKRK